MKKRRMICLICALLLCFLSACTKNVTKSDETTSTNETTLAEPKTDSGTTDSETEPETQAQVTFGPLIVTYTNRDYVTVSIEKSLFDPLTAQRNFQASFYDSNRELCMNLYIGEGEYSQCQISYGDFGDTRTSMVSDYGNYKDLGDRILYEIFLNNPNTTIAGGDNLPVGQAIFEKPVTCDFPDQDEAWYTYDAKDIFVFDIDQGIVEGAERINELLFTCDLDREYLTPTSDDYRVEIYEIPQVVVYRQASTIRPPGSPLRFGTDPSGDAELVPCKVIRVTEYDKGNGDVTAYSEKVIFENERDALCIPATNYRNENHPYQFIDQIGVDYCPDDFEPMPALATMCDKLMPAYYAKVCSNIGIDGKMQRDENVYYRKFYNLTSGFNATSQYSGYSELDFLNCILKTFGPEFSANNCDKTGFMELTKEYEYDLPSGAGTNEYRATIYYSKPNVHSNEIIIGDGSTGGLPDEVASMEKDGEYFTPATSNYMIFYVKMSPYEVCNTDAALISFDKSGNIVSAVYRLYKPDNMLNPMEELVGWKLEWNGDVSLLYTSDNLAYFDITNCNDLKVRQPDGAYGKALTRQELLDSSIGEKEIKMPCESWSNSHGLFITE